MYNDIIVIFTCAFAIFGFYSVIRELFDVFCKKHKMVGAIYISENADIDALNNAVEYAKLRICEHSFFEAEPVFITDFANVKYIKDLKYTVYVKYTEEIWSGRITQ